jgi:glycosyltransferase involved in cell wall biosynthesis
MSRRAAFSDHRRHALPVKRKIAFVLPTHWEAVMGGSQYQAKVLIEHLLDRYEADVSFLAGLTKPAFEPRGYRIVNLSGADNIRRHGELFDAFRLYRALLRLRPDVIYQQVACVYTGIAAFYSERCGARMVWRVTSDRSVRRRQIKWWRIHERLEQRLIEYGIRRAHLILAQTESQKAALAAHYDRSDAIVVPNFHPPPANGRTARGAERPAQVVWIANLKRLKNPGAFVRLARRLAARNDVRFIMVGALIERGRWLDEVLHEIESTRNLSYLGPIEQDGVNALFDDCDLLVNTSDYEGFPNTFIQAWMRGVPVVALHVDPDSLLSAKGLGYCSRDEDGLLRDVTRLLDDRELRNRIGACARAYALERHSTAHLDDLARLLGLARIQEPHRVENGAGSGSPGR